MRLPTATLDGRSRIAWICGIALLVLAVMALVAAAAIRLSAARGKPNTGDLRPAPSATHPTEEPLPDRGVVDPTRSATAAQEVAHLKAAPEVAPQVSTRLPRITGPAARQPDLYARAFAARLLTQDFRSPRADLLAWVQAESAQTTEPTVIGLVPAALRHKWAVFSLTDDQPTPPIPTPDEWQALAHQHAHATVHIQRVLEPVTWSTAVLAGDITDPGATAREVDALVTLHSTTRGRPQTSATSVALTMNLEGPPSRPTWGFVTAVTYRAVPVGAP